MRTSFARTIDMPLVHRPHDAPLEIRSWHSKSENVARPHAMLGDLFILSDARALQLACTISTGHTAATKGHCGHQQAQEQLRQLWGWHGSDDVKVLPCNIKTPGWISSTDHLVAGISPGPCASVHSA